MRRATGLCNYNGCFATVSTCLEHPPSRSPFITISLAVCLALGVANASGWVLDIPLFLSLFEHLPKMVPATTLLVFLCVASVWAQAQQAHASRAGTVFGACACVASALILACYLVGAAPPPFHLPHNGGQTAWSLSAPVTAGLFGMLGVAQVLLARDRDAELAQVVATAVLLVSTLNFAGYFFQDTLVYRLLPGKGVSLPTTAALILLAASTLLLRPRRGIMVVIAGSSPSALAARRLLLSAMLAPVLLAIGAAAALHARAYDAETLIPLFAWAMLVLLVLLIWRFAYRLYDTDLARTHAQQELQQALQELRAERDRKDVFLATLAHELRNPLAPIKSAADLLHHLRDPDRARLDKVGSLISRQVDHMVHLVDDLLDVSRIGRGQMKLELAPVDIRAAVTDALEQVRPAIERKGHTCQVDLAAEPITVLGDHKRLVQVVANLLNNAVKYTPEHGTLQVGLTADPRQVRIVVHDNGIGIDAALLPKVFETFTQATLTPERGEGGLGLGLALVKRLSELHGGTVRAESGGPGAGSSFTVLLPREGADRAAGVASRRGHQGS